MVDLSGLVVDLVSFGLVTLLSLLELAPETEPLLLFSLSGSENFVIQAFFSLWTYLNSSGLGVGSACLCSGFVEVWTGITDSNSVTTAVLTTEVMGVASAVRTALPRVLGSLTRCS